MPLASAGPLEVVEAVVEAFDIDGSDYDLRSDDHYRTPGPHLLGGPAGIVIHQLTPE